MRQVHVCGNCSRVVPSRRLVPLDGDWWDRVEPDGIVPSGECPDCGALTYLSPSRWTESPHGTAARLDSAIRSGRAAAALRAARS